MIAYRSRKRNVAAMMRSMRIDLLDQPMNGAELFIAGAVMGLLIVLLLFS